MASLSNDLEGLSLNLPDVVAEAIADNRREEITPSSSTTTTPRGQEQARQRGSGQKRKCRGTPKKKKERNQRGEEKAQEEEEVQLLDDSTLVDGACALPGDDGEEEDQRVPDIDFSLADFQLLASSKNEEEEEEVVTSNVVVVKKAGSRTRRNKKGRRKRKSTSAAAATSSRGSVSATTLSPEDKKGIEDVKSGDTSFPFDNDSDEEEEPKYIWRNITRSGCIKKCVLVHGKMDLGRPKPGDTVLVKFQGKLKDGTIVDDYPTTVFNVGEYEVIDGLDLAVQSMYKNELSIVSIKPELAYGERGRGNRAPSGRTEESVIPGNARITYLFGLLHFEKAKDASSMTWAQRRKSGQARLRIANWWYQRKEYPVAVKCYKKSLEFYNDVQATKECSSAEEYKELLQFMEERLRVMRQVANTFKRIATLIQSGDIPV